METLVKEPSSSYTVRFQDCDLMGHLNNARFIDYMLNAREDHLSEFYGISLRDFMTQGFGWLVSSHEIYYLKPALYNEKVIVRTSLVHYGEMDLVVEGIMTDTTETQIKAMLWTRYVFINTKTGKKQPYPEHLIKFFSSILHPELSLAKGSKARLQDLLAGMKSKL